MASTYVVGRVGDIPDGEHRVVDVNGRGVGIYNVGGTFYGLLDRCPHMGAKLCDGVVADALRSDGPGDYQLDPGRRFVICPWHGWEFDVATGESWFDARRTRVKSYDVAVACGADLAAEVEAGGRVKGPHQAERVEISTEDDYIVVTLPR
ncbi:MAG: Rieske 2Fe-2S domain-containing protein [Pseudonocardia sp.]|uniref:Rieske (2Fe-2S) protein n=1 Tax=unclassified Pseudonocardia TaxID=2619320 RepID=UPI00086CBDFE|nr:MULTISPECIES: Rieske 2Fe-2S domain-containing protein [unclassified Pseudonocardia]MBN9109351.1 Rieske 2Fe-2S domain-containing protein [Pseudonocardia sp.]ODU29509.1 MAG: hypothetical protein ABS80_01775 [Pseudonocardia sp. SCN 72-51]ODV08064.1 MAG: hypothetical protein ABT15_05065 [Pseudonocardia sp. SCN 73-27]